MQITHGRCLWLKLLQCSYFSLNYNHIQPSTGRTFSGIWCSTFYDKWLIVFACSMVTNWPALLQCVIQALIYNRKYRPSREPISGSSRQLIRSINMSIYQQAFLDMILIDKVRTIGYRLVIVQFISTSNVTTSPQTGPMVIKLYVTEQGVFVSAQGAPRLVTLNMFYSCTAILPNGSEAGTNCHTLFDKSRRKIVNRTILNRWTEVQRFKINHLQQWPLGSSWRAIALSTDNIRITETREGYNSDNWVMM